MHSSPPPPLVHETSALLELQKPSQSLCTRRVPCWEGTDLLELQSLVHETSALLEGTDLLELQKPSETLHETSALLEGTDLLESESSRKTGLLLPQKMVDAPDEEEIAMRMCVLWQSMDLKQCLARGNRWISSNV